MVPRPLPYSHKSVMFSGYVADSTDSDTFEIAMFTVNRKEKLIRTKFSRVVSFDILK